MEQNNITVERINELAKHEDLRGIVEIFKEWYNEYKLFGFGTSAFRILDKDTDLELNSAIDFPYAIILDGKAILGHINVHLRKGLWWFSEQDGDFKTSVFEHDKNKDSDWYKKIDSLLFKR